MSVRDLQFADPKPGQEAAPFNPPRSGAWAIRRAPSWRRRGPKAVVPPVKTIRALAFDVFAIVVGLGLGLAVIAVVTASGVL